MGLPAPSWQSATARPERLDRDPRLRIIGFNREFPPVHLFTVADVNGNGSRELVVFGSHPDGRQRAMITDGRSGR